MHDDDQDGGPGGDEPGEGPFGPGGLGAGGFGDIGFFLQDLSRMLAGGAGGSWDAAAQLAGSIASQGAPESNVDPVERMAVEQLARVAELQVQEVTGRPLDQPIRLEPLNRTQWARRFLDDEQGLLESIAGSIGQALQAQLGDLDADGFGGLPPGMPGMPPEALIRQVVGMMGPMLLGMMAGSTAGHLAARALGHYELPLPRPTGQPITMVLGNVDAFADSWSLPRDSVRLWVCLSDVVHEQVLTMPHVRARLDDLLRQYASGFEHDPDDLERRMRELGIDELIGTGEPDLHAIQRLAGDPDVLLGAMQSDTQRWLVPQIEAVVAAIEGYVDHVLDTIGSRLLPDYQRVTEALRRRRVEFGPESRFVERLFGLELTQATFDRGADFVSGIIERAGADVVDALWADAESLPTPAELTAPGLWLARVGVDTGDTSLTGDSLPDDALDDLDFEIPDYLPDDFGDST